MRARAAVLYVHGLWMRGAEALLLGRRLSRQRGYRLQVFHYGSVHEPLETVLARLSDTIARLEASEVHLIGHSLGGAVILHCLARHRMSQAGRVVFIGAPVLGSRSAQTLARWPLGTRLLGQGAAQLMLGGGQRRWAQSRELGVIAGTAPIGFGQLLLRFNEPSDGTVAVSETQLPGAKACLSVPVTHMGLVFSARVAQEVGSFLQYGSFGQ